MFEKLKEKKRIKEQKAMEAREQDIKQRMEKDENFRIWMEEQQKKEDEFKDSLTRKPKAVEFQKKIMDNLICPLCSHDKFLNKSFAQSKGSINYSYTIESFKICRRCGLMIRYYDFNRDDFDTTNFDAEGDAILLNATRHS